jgi:lipid II:glycine glycyltransferase (peptidoglycan interpeptide bridge formation enzyme)
LKRSAKYGLRIEQWSNPDAKSIAAVYREMEKIKGNVERVPERDLEPLIRCLGERLLVFRALDANGQTLALRAAAIMGERAWDMLAAAGAAARKTYATYATFWSLAEECRRRGARTFDMGGIDPEANKGVYDFKKGTGAQPVHYLGEWDYAIPGVIRHLANWSLRGRQLGG